LEVTEILPTQTQNLQSTEQSAARPETISTAGYELQSNSINFNLTSSTITEFSTLSSKNTEERSIVSTTKTGVETTEGGIVTSVATTSTPLILTSISTTITKPTTTSTTTPPTTTEKQLVCEVDQKRCSAFTAAQKMVYFLKIYFMIIVNMISFLCKFGSTGSVVTSEIVVNGIKIIFNVNHLFGFVRVFRRNFYERRHQILFGIEQGNVCRRCFQLHQSGNAINSNRNRCKAKHHQQHHKRLKYKLNFDFENHAWETDVIKDDTWTSGAAYCASFVPTLVWCSSDLNVTLAQLQQPTLWWNKLSTGDVNNGLALTAASAFVGKEISSPMNFICQVAQLDFIFKGLKMSLVLQPNCSRKPECLQCTANVLNFMISYKINIYVQ
jgi:hypothetical protein